MNASHYLSAIRTIAMAAFVFGSFGASRSHGEVTQAADDGFQLTIERTVSGVHDDAYKKFVDQFSSWYDASHSYSAQAKNLSLDLQEKCMLEKLPDGGFVRHMEIVFYQPGKMLRMTGGLGPLQGMGINGALTFTFKPEDTQTKVQMNYIVSGPGFLKLKRFAAPVDQVLTGQMDRFQKHCE